MLRFATTLCLLTLTLNLFTQEVLSNTFDAITIEYPGSVVTQVVDYSIDVKDFIQQTDGKYVLFGTATGEDGSLFVTARYNKNGQLDKTFGDNGIVMTRYAQHIGWMGQSIIQDQQGRLVAFGSTTRFDIYSPEKYEIGMVRYNDNGTMDINLWNPGPAYNFLAGYLMTTRGDSDDFQGSDILLGNDGNYIISVNLEKTLLASTSVILSRVATVMKYSNDLGQYEIAFNGGTVEHELLLPNKALFVFGGLIQNDDKILVCGMAVDADDQKDLFFSRLNYNGFSDLDFGNDGNLTIDIFGEVDLMLHAVQQKNEKIVAVGTTTQNGKRGVVVIRLELNGTLDNGFGDSGIKTIFMNENTEPLGGVVLTQEDEILIAGYTKNENEYDILLMKLTQDGQMDLNFGDNGITITDIDRTDEASGIISMPDGTIVIGGSTWDGSTSKFFLTRFNSNGELAPSFASSVDVPEENICDINHLEICNNEVECTSVGGNWCEGTCQAKQCYSDEFQAGMQKCINDPASCGIPVGHGGFTQADLDAKYDAGYNAGISVCSSDDCTPPSLSAGLDLHIPDVNYKPLGGNPMNLWIDFEFYSEDNGFYLWLLKDFGVK
ncbi:MAG: hypothetical protein HQK65_06550 [Desulfamplus sp.]|nr:hypothetical protein [Desulfamplus sp.]